MFARTIVQVYRFRCLKLNNGPHTAPMKMVLFCLDICSLYRVSSLFNMRSFQIYIAFMRQSAAYAEHRISLVW